MPQRTPRPLNTEALWGYALKVLGVRACSTSELREKLRRRAERREDVEPTLARLKELGYLDDRRFAEGFANARLSNEKFGRTRVLRDLRQRRVAPTLAERAVRDAYQDVNEEALIEDWVRRKYRLASRDSLLQDDKDFASAYRRLLHAGFRSGDIIRVLKRFAKNPELLDSFDPPDESYE